MGKQVKIYTAIGDGETVTLSKSGTNRSSIVDFIRDHKSKGRLVEIVLETRAALELKIFESILYDIQYFNDHQTKEIEAYLTKVRDYKMDKVANLMSKKRYTDKLFTRPHKLFSYKRVATSKYYDMVGKSDVIESFKPVKIEIRKVDNLMV